MLLMNNILNKLPKQLCTCCGACVEVCHKKCIKLEKDENQILYPVISVNECIECNLCITACPVLINRCSSHVKDVYAVKCKDEKLLESSNSGGFFSTFASYILDNNGVVCGAEYSEQLQVQHIVIETKRDLWKLQGSKYVQSNAHSCFPIIKKYLKEGRIVLFSGTGCQIGGLKGYLSKEYINLITIELVCHGVTAPSLFEYYIKWLECKKGSRISEFQFRSKKIRPTGEHCKFRYVVDGKEYKGYALEDPYYSSFLSGKILRDSCYHCFFKGEIRIADFTIGDYWGIEKINKDFPANHGVNVLMINSDKGCLYWNEIKNLFCFDKSTYENAIMFNPSIWKSTSIKNKINYNIDSKSLFEKDLASSFNLINFLKGRIPWKLKMLIKNI